MSRYTSTDKDIPSGKMQLKPGATAPPTPTPASTVPQAAPTPPKTEELRESPYTIPNALTLARIASCPVLAYCIVKGEFEWATGILVAGGFSDWLDGYIARRFNMRSVFGTILDPAADKTLMTTLVVTLAYKGLLPMPLAILILGRDVALSLSAFWYRYISLPEPKTFKRYWDFSIPSAEVRPTQISKYNTALQLVLMGTTTISPLITGVDISGPLQALQWTVAGTTIWSGLSYIGSKDAVKILSKK
ncbi:hypothetical protein QFC20_000241 [Naganishia adeliensis]|uniref:Uncharacterized protein n=1 Tax=Naganishia adeliensis TaxID=92952 RepID=A0ACC2X3K4_9TREE|nr:hypothetical protein QFC20_000241 [Naganishia adeliensis]